MSRVAYLTLFFVNAIVAALLREYGSYVISRLSSILSGVFSECDGCSDSGTCFGNQLVYRMSFSLGCFFVLTGLLSVALARGYENCCCLLFFQIPFYVAMLVASLFIPNTFFDGYADIARVASGAFIILQIVIIVDWTYNIRDFFLSKMEDAEQDHEARQALLESNYESLSEPSAAHATKWEAGYLTVVFMLTAFSAAGVVLLFKAYSGCELNITFIAITIFAVVVITVLSVLSWVNVGLLPAAAVSSYLVFLCYQAVHSNPDETCTHVDTASTKSIQKSALLNAALAAFTITWTSWRTSATKTNLLSLSPSVSSSSSSSSLLRNRSDHHRQVPGEKVPVDDHHIKEETAIDDDNEAAQVVQQVPEYQFHLLMVLSSFYMAMVITNWGSSTGTDTIEDKQLSMWVKIMSQWVATAIYLWTLVAPSVLTDRDFGYA